MIGVVVKKVMFAIASVLILGSLSLAGPANASAPPPTAPGAPADAPAYDPSVPAPGPGDLTWAQVAEIEKGSATFGPSATPGQAHPNAVTAGGEGSK